MNRRCNALDSDPHRCPISTVDSYKFYMVHCWSTLRHLLEISKTSNSEGRFCNFLLWNLRTPTKAGGHSNKEIEPLQFPELELKLDVFSSATSDTCTGPHLLLPLSLSRKRRRRCFADEDLMGKVARVGKMCHKSAFPLAYLRRHLLLLCVRWTARAESDFWQA